MRLIMPLAILGMLVWLISSCVDPEPAEISIRSTLNGRPMGANVQVWNSKGVQLTEASGDNNGVAYVKGLPPGTYTLKFVDHQGNPYAAQITVTVESNDSQMRLVELSDPTGGAASAGGSTT